MGVIVKNGIVYNPLPISEDLSNYITKDEIEGFEKEDIDFEEILKEKEDD